jgi:hypothetical protein
VSAKLVLTREVSPISRVQVVWLNVCVPESTADAARLHALSISDPVAEYAVKALRLLLVERQTTPPSAGSQLQL